LRAAHGSAVRGGGRANACLQHRVDATRLAALRHRAKPLESGKGTQAPARLTGPDKAWMRTGQFFGETVKNLEKEMTAWA